MTRIFKDCKEAMGEVERDIYEMGITVFPHSMQNKNVKDNDDYSTLEVQNYSFTILDTKDKDEIIPNLEWCKAEFKERIAKEFTNPGKAWKLREKIWKEFLNSTCEFDYTYNNRMNRYNQINRVIAELIANPDTRQAIIQVHFPSDIYSFQKERIPCSMHYQLMIRRGKLDIIYSMRSSDFATHFSNDVWLACELRDYIAKKIEVPSGLFSYHAGSLHIYKNYGGKKHVF